MELYPLLILLGGQFGEDKIGNYLEPTLGALMAPLAQGGARRWWGRCACTLGAAALGPTHLGAAFTLWAAGRAWIIPTLVLGPDSQGRWASLLVSLLRFVEKRIVVTFSTYSCICPIK
jgi:hypothetical protein